MSEEEAGEPDPVEEPADDLVTTRHTLRTDESAGRRGDLAGAAVVRGG